MGYAEVWVVWVEQSSTKYYHIRTELGNGQTMHDICQAVCVQFSKTMDASDQLDLCAQQLTPMDNLDVDHGNVVNLYLPATT